MVRNLSVDTALEEISRIESLIKPYEYQVYEARETLRFLSDLRESLNRMDREKLADALKNLRRALAKDKHSLEELLAELKKIRKQAEELLDDK